MPHHNPAPEEFRLLGFTAEDKADTERMVVDEDRVSALADLLRARIGLAEIEPPAEPVDEFAALATYLRTLPDIRAFHTRLGVADEISWATLADLGRQVELHRRTHGVFGFETYWWLISHWLGSLYQLGRLQFLLYRETGDVPGVEPGEWVVGVHIPETGPLTPAAVDDSLAQAKEFFARYFSDRPVRTATLTSWLLDPVLLDRLPAESNMAGFGRRFTPYGKPADGAESAVYFTFRSRDLDHLDRLPRDTALQRLVLDRVGSGHGWQNAHGYLRLT
jgi:GNAT-like C-terminal domain/N-acyltransferase N-terminal domain